MDDATQVVSLEMVLELGRSTDTDDGALGEDLPAADGSVDRVVANCVLSRSTDRRRVLAEIARVLKPGGRLRAADIVAEGLPDWVRRSPALHNACVRRAGSEADYLAGLRHAGLRHATVGGRHVYDRRELHRLADGDIVDVLVGRVWSAHFSAMKPQRL